MTTQRRRTHADAVAGHDDLAASIKGRDRAPLLSLAQSLSDDRPRPAPGFRSAVRSALLSGGGGRQPMHVRLLVFAYGGAGTLLLGIASVGLAGVGPLAAS